MPVHLKYVAQQALDLFYQNYKSDIDFWNLGDAIDFTGNAASAIYQNFYQQEYAMLRSEKKDDVVQFDIGWLDEQVLKVENKGGILISKLSCPVMTFPYDRQQSGIQLILITNPASIDEVERTSISAAWQLNYLPVTNKIFWYGDVGRIVFIKKGTCNAEEVRVLYVPVMSADANVPDGIIDQVIMNTVNMMRQAADKKVIKKSLDHNQNEILETEVNKTALKP